MKKSQIFKNEQTIITPCTKELWVLIGQFRHTDNRAIR